MNSSDFLIIGGGIIGVCVARELKKRFQDSKIILIEKEIDCGLHASGRNSGVLHAGFYYTADSLKARFTRNGNQFLTEYCESKNLKINKCGKLVVAKNEQELSQLDKLLERGRKNGVYLQDLSAAEARSIEPRVKTYQRALFSPATSTVDPKEVLQALLNDALHEGIEIRTGTRYLGRTKTGVVTSSGNIDSKYVVNSAGLYADKIGQDFGFSMNHRILPFKGLYLYSSEAPGSLRTNIYPVPDLRNPFLGVHFTVTVDGLSKIGPTAIPALWREQYCGLENFELAELMDIIARQLGLFVFSNFDFKRLAYDEIKKYSRANLVSQSSSLLENVKTGNFKKWGKPGIRAQLINLKEKKLEMDFVLEGNDQSMHILNAVSPGFTCAFPFAEYICDQIAIHLN
jgi:L-2-hydroxyglutarate oxidase LhgO